MGENFKKELNEFFGKAMLATYAGNGLQADSGTGFTELEFKEMDIENFRGDEEISHKGDLVFTHHFFGGFVRSAKDEIHR